MSQRCQQQTHAPASSLGGTVMPRATFLSLMAYVAKRDASPQEEAVIRCVSSGFFVLLAFQLVRVPVAQL